MQLLKEERVSRESFFKALQCLTQPLVRCIAIDLHLLVVIQMLLYVYFCSLNGRAALQVSGGVAAEEL